LWTIDRRVEKDGEEMKFEEKKSRKPSGAGKKRRGERFQSEDGGRKKTNGSKERTSRRKKHTQRVTGGTFERRRSTISGLREQTSLQPITDEKRQHTRTGQKKRREVLHGGAHQQYVGTWDTLDRGRGWKKVGGYTRVGQWQKVTP